MSMFELFLESMESVPPELERNFTLITELDKKSDDLMKKINKLTEDYKEKSSRYARNKVREETNRLFDKIDSYAEDKSELSKQTYDLIDRSITKLSSLNNSEPEAPKTLYGMPVDDNEPLFCICRKVSFGEMIGCDNDDCPIEWFHNTCVNISDPPKGEWYCPQCASNLKSSTTTKKQPRSRGRKGRKSTAY